MKKSEFEKILMKNLELLPKNEKNKIKDYYDEIYLDKLENGAKEEEIVKEWGSPVDAAIKVLNEDEYKSYNPKNYTEPSIAEEKYKKVKTKSESIFKNKTFWNIYLSLFFITIPLTIAFFSVLVAVAAVLFSIFISIYILAVAIFISGAVLIIYGIIQSFGSFALGFANIGAGLLAIGLGFVFILIAIGFNKIIKLIFGKRRKK